MAFHFVDNRQLKRIYLGCTPDEPAVEFTETDVRNPSWHYDIEIPFGAQFALALWTQDNPAYASTFGSNRGSLGQVSVRGLGVTREASFYADGDPVGSMTYATQAGVCSQMALIALMPHPVGSGMYVKSPVASDPGSDVPGRTRIWFWKEVA